MAKKDPIRAALKTLRRKAGKRERCAAVEVLKAEIEVLRKQVGACATIVAEVRKMYDSFNDVTENVLWASMDDAAYEDFTLVRADLWKDRSDNGLCKPEHPGDRR